MQSDSSRGLLEALLRDAGVGVAFLDLEGRYERVNDRLAAMHDRSPEDHVGRLLEDVVPHTAAAVRAHMERAVERGETVTAEISGEMPDQPGVQRAWSSSFVPVRGSDETILGCAAIVFEITERRRTEDRAALIAQVATLLDHSLDLETTVHTLCRVAVPRLADWCTISLLASDGTIERAAIAHSDPAREALGWDVARRWPARLDDPVGLGEVLRTGESQYHPETTSETLDAAARDAEHREMIDELGVRTVFIVPLRARGRVFGAMSYAMADSGRAFSDDDRQLLEELTDRASLAVDNARLHTELQRTSEAQRFLAQAGQVLSASLDWETTCQTVAHLATTGFADWCSVHAVGPDGEVRPIATAHVDPVKLNLLEDMHETFPIENDSGYIGAAMSAIEPRLIVEVDDELRVRVAYDEKHLELLRRLDARSVILAPMVARGRSLGAIMFAISESDRRYGAEDVALAGELARRAAIAADNARLYSDRSRVARALQRSLLPARLPDVPGIDLAPFYMPAGDQVAGDFYDAFPAGSAWGFVIGDVCGKGAEAAALTGLARHTVRTAAAYERDAAGVLRRLHSALADEEDGGLRFLTAAFLRLEPAASGTFRGTAAVGGHIPPVIVRAGGAVERIDGTGPLLGVLPVASIGERPVELRRGDVLVLATDGVTDAGAPLDAFGEERLVELAAETARAGASAAEVAEAIGAAALSRQPGRMRDDVTLLVVRVI